MLDRKVFGGMILACGLAAGYALPARAAVVGASGPSAAQISLKLVEPSTISSSGAYEVQLVQVDPSPSNCSFYLYRDSEAYGGWQYLGSHRGTSYTDTLQGDFDYIQYYMIPVDCSGNEGSAAYSPNFFPYTLDNPFAAARGSGTTLTSSTFYGGSTLATVSGKNAEVTWNTDHDYNFAVVVGTGPLGGIGTVYVDGAKTGTINFYSKSLTGMRILFKFGTSTGVSHTVLITATGKGKGGGYTMYLDAGVENVS